MTGWSASLTRHNGALLALALAAFIAALWPIPINHDSAFIFLAAERLIGGQSLYFDQSLVSPPVGFWMHAGAAIIDRWVGSIVAAGGGDHRAQLGVERPDFGFSAKLKPPATGLAVVGGARRTDAALVG